MDTQPRPVRSEEWEEIVRVVAVRDAWGLSDETPAEFASVTYGVRFDYSSREYTGDLFILYGDVLADVPPIALVRDDDGKLMAWPPQA